MFFSFSKGYLIKEIENIFPSSNRTIEKLVEGSEKFETAWKHSHFVLIAVTHRDYKYNTRGGIVIFFSENKREHGDWGANSNPGCRAKR